MDGQAYGEGGDQEEEESVYIKDNIVMRKI